jgi:hypothetical protein
MCAICDLNIEFSIEHPMTFEVAVATRQAIDSGALPAPEAGGAVVDALAERKKAIDALTGFQRRLEQALSREALLALPEFFVLVIESRTWGFYRPTPSGFDPRCRPSAPRVLAEDPAERDVVVVVSQLAAQQIIAGKMPFADAAARGLIAIDAGDARGDALLSAWRAAYPKIGFSRYVCA